MFFHVFKTCFFRECFLCLFFIFANPDIIYLKGNTKRFSIVQTSIISTRCSGKLKGKTYLFCREHFRVQSTTDNFVPELRLRVNQCRKMLAAF